MYFALGAFIFVATLVLGWLIERAEHCRRCGSWFRFHTHRFGPMCRVCGDVKEMQ